MVNNKANSTSFKKGHKLNKGVKNPNWKGDNAGYGSKHDWLKVRYGKPKYCEHCSTTKAKKYEWANVSGKYLRDRGDWIRLCTSCHRKFDNHSIKMWETRRSKNA